MLWPVENMRFSIVAAAWSWVRSWACAIKYNFHVYFGLQNDVLCPVVLRVCMLTRQSDQFRYHSTREVKRKAKQSTWNIRPANLCWHKNKTTSPYTQAIEVYRAHNERESKSEHGDVIASIQHAHVHRSKNRLTKAAAATATFSICCVRALSLYRPPCVVCFFFPTRHRCVRSSVVCFIIFSSQVYACGVFSQRCDFYFIFSSPIPKFCSITVCACLFSKDFASDSVSIHFFQ